MTSSSRLNLARQRLKEEVRNTFFRDENGRSLIERTSKGENISMPLHKIGWNYNSIDNLRMLVLDPQDKGKDVIIGEATDDCQTELHYHSETERLQVIIGEVEELISGKKLTDSECIEIKPTQEHQFKFKKGTLFSLVFEPKIK